MSDSFPGKATVAARFADPLPRTLCNGKVTFDAPASMRGPNRGWPMADDAAVAFEQFYARYYGRLSALATSQYGATDADDVAQEVMVRAYVAFDVLELDRRDRDPWPWLALITRNVALERHARGAR